MRSNCLPSLSLARSVCGLKISPHVSKLVFVALFGGLSLEVGCSNSVPVPDIEPKAVKKTARRTVAGFVRSNSNTAEHRAKESHDSFSLRATSGCGSIRPQVLGGSSRAL